ncbi:MAG: tRNA preQ1(34) S-adenosylmethionine ribosyltransferase-isomerase QueA [Acidobacteriota bacterium]
MWRRDFEFDLPSERIARYPASPRDASRLLVLPPAGDPIHGRFRALPSHFSPGDVLVLNDTKVIPARLLGALPGGGRAEVFLLKPAEDGESWDALVKPGRKLKAGAFVSLSGGSAGLEILAAAGEGRRKVRARGANMETLIRAFGSTPLPPYIARPPEEKDARRYQTVYAREGRSVAAPTAGLHFTPRVLRALETGGVRVVRLRLDVGPGTFKPVTAERVEDHRMDPEPYAVPEETAREVNAALAEGRRVVAVGTTVTRSLEDQMRRHGTVIPGEYETDLFITPGFRFRAVSGLVTNFHLPGSTLIMLVSALAGRERVLSAYREAVALNYRFYSYGDAMLAWGAQGR